MGSEILTWINIPDGCGAYAATEIYRSENLNGPFTLLAELTDPNATTFSDPNPGGELRYYTLRYRYDCPGVVVLNSDTLDNLIPLSPIIASVGLEDAGIVISWLASPSPEVSAYVVLEQFPSGNVVIDTVFSGLEFTLPVAPGDPPVEDRVFLLVAIDPCGNDSPQGRAAGVMDLSGTGGFACTETITLEVDQAAIVNYLPASLLELFVSTDGGAFLSAGTFPPNAATIGYNGANDGEDLCFYVEAVLAGDRGRARSVEYCQLIDFSQPVRDFPLYGAEVNTNGEVILQYGLAANQAVPTAARLLVTRGAGVTEAFDLTGFTFGSGTVVIPALADLLEPGDGLRLRVIDECMREITTNTVAPIFLDARAFILVQNSLSWTPFVNNLDGTFTYSVARAFVADPGAVAGAMFELIAMDIDEVALTDNTGNNQGIACYQVSVRFLPADGTPGESATFRSNVVCVLPRAKVFVPNVFSPNANEADNTIFLPRFSSLPPAEGYSLRVFDRWGGLLFETSDPSVGWAGDSNGQILSSGTFMYQLSFLAPDGETQRKAGTVNLLR